ncbi:MAG: hypothetical protein HZA51_14385 [Planctomycetes bacterium]|nr:hypothetical protein [Planctomycetota bacterium]
MDKEEETLEDQLVRLATSGKLAGAARDAVRRQLAGGFSAVFLRGRKVIRLSPDGKIDVLATLNPLTNIRGRAKKKPSRK